MKGKERKPPRRGEEGEKDAADAGKKVEHAQPASPR
jgi:hypothetical protein